MTDISAQDHFTRDTAFRHGRRDFLRNATLLGGATALVQPFDVMAMMQNKEKSAENAVVQAVSEHARATEHPREYFELPRWKPDHTGPYDLSDPIDNHYAFAKTHINLAGEYSFLVQYGTVIMAPPGEAPFPWLGRVSIAQVFATPVLDDILPEPGLEDGRHDYVIYGTLNQVFVDARTYEPIEEAYNPYTDTIIDTSGVAYADRLAFRLGKSIIVPGVDPAFYDQPWDRDGEYSQHHIHAGDEVSYSVLGAAQKPGPQQPRVDYAFWTAKTDDLMNPALASIDCRRDYSAMMKVSEYSWMGVPLGDEAQMLIHKTGIKTQNPARLPSFTKKLFFDRYPGRFIL